MAIPAKYDLPLPLAAQRLGLSWPQMMRLVLTRQLPAEKRGGRWFVAKADVDSLADSPAK